MCCFRSGTVAALLGAPSRRRRAAARRSASDRRFGRGPGSAFAANAGPWARRAAACVIAAAITASRLVLMPACLAFTSKIVSNNETSDVTMPLDEGSVKDLVATPPPSQDRVPVTAANRRGIVDPLTAVLFSAGGAGEMLSPEACRRALPIFDGHQRYDLKLAFKRMDKVTVEKGYAGPVVVCSVNYEPIAGHRANIPLVKYLSEGREMEIAFAPIAGMRLLAPFRLSVVSTLANLVIEANRFETIMVPAPESTPPNIAHSPEVSPPSRDGVVQRCERANSGLVLCQEVPKPAPERR